MGEVVHYMGTLRRPCNLDSVFLKNEASSMTKQPTILSLSISNKMAFRCEVAHNPLHSHNQDFHLKI